MKQQNQNSERSAAAQKLHEYLISKLVLVGFCYQNGIHPLKTKSTEFNHEQFTILLIPIGTSNETNVAISEHFLKGIREIVDVIYITWEKTKNCYKLGYEFKKSNNENKKNLQRKNSTSGKRKQPGN